MNNKIEPGCIDRRGLLSALAVLPLPLLLFHSDRAWAGSYLNRAALLVAEASREANYLRARLYDKELARLVHELSIGRLKAARAMSVPKEVKEANPHLLLMLERYERACHAAVERNAQRFIKRLGEARDETQVFRSILEQLGWPLPKI